MQYQLLSRADGNPKTAKGMKRGVMTFPLHMAPADLSGNEVCPMRTAGCTAACLNTAGRGGMPGSIGEHVQAARMRRTLWYFSDRAAFMAQLVSEVAYAIRYSARKGYDAAFRLNATSDIPWHRIPVAGAPNIMALFPNVQFYDYTKVEKRMRERLPLNYHLTFSLADGNAIAAHKVLLAGGNVAAVFRDKPTVARAIANGFAPLGSWPANRPAPATISGDETDLRFLDPRGVVVALYAKGRAKKDQSGFVIDL